VKPIQFLSLMLLAMTIVIVFMLSRHQSAMQEPVQPERVAPVPKMPARPP
jgi:hypothetical protein